MSVTATLAGFDPSTTFTGEISVTLARRAAVVEFYYYFPNPVGNSGQLSPEEFASIVSTGDQKVAAELNQARSSTG